MLEKGITYGTIARTVVLILALVNQLLTMSGHNPLPWSEDQLYEAISMVITVIASLIAWWKNNSFTSAAITADKEMRLLKSRNK